MNWLHVSQPLTSVSRSFQVGAALTENADCSKALLITESFWFWHQYRKRRYGYLFPCSGWWGINMCRAECHVGGICCLSQEIYSSLSNFTRNQMVLYYLYDTLQLYWLANVSLKLMNIMGLILVVTFSISHSWPPHIFSLSIGITQSPFATGLVSLSSFVLLLCNSTDEEGPKPCRILYIR